jgi:hypothetical protein
LLLRSPSYLTLKIKYTILSLANFFITSFQNCFNEYSIAALSKKLNLDLTEYNNHLSSTIDGAKPIVKLKKEREALKRFPFNNERAETIDRMKHAGGPCPARAAKPRFVSC